jgi:hypothetical protein
MSQETALDPKNLVVFYSRPQDALAAGIVASILLLALVLYNWRTRNPIKPRLFFFVVAILTVIGPGLIGLYVWRGGKPSQLLAVSASGVWCHSWGSWVPWREISWVDSVNTTNQLLTGRGRHRGISATFDLNDSGLANHPWSPGVRISRQVTCAIDDLDRTPDDAFRSIREFYQSAR